MNAILLGTAILVAAPALKEAPKKETGIVGEWIPESMTMAGKAAKAPTAGLRYEFTNDGKWIIRREGKDTPSTPREFKVDTKADPHTIDVGSPAKGGVGPSMLGIYKVEGDSLTICFAPGGERPTSFAPEENARFMVMVLKRAKK
jgi:uncharacterized protein (TIGR03067 family)